MSLRRTTFFIAILTVAVLFASVVGVSRVMLMQRFEKVERREAGASAERAKAALERLVSRLSVSAQDYSSWDDMYSYVETHDAKFVESNFTTDTLRTLELSFRAVFSAEGTPIFAESWEKGAAQTSPFSEPVMGALRKAGVISKAIAGEALGGLLDCGDGFALVAAQPILKSDRSGPSRGCVVFGRMLGAEDLGVVRELAAVDAEMVRARTDMEATHTVSDDTLETQIGLADLSGEGGLSLRCRTPRVIMEQGRLAMRHLMMMLGIAGVVFAVTIVVVMDRVVVKRALLLGEQLLEIKNGTLSRVVVPGQDELAEVGTEFNELLDALESSRERLEEGEERFRAMAASCPLGVFVTDGRGVCTYVNAAFLELSGMEASTAVGAEWTEAVNPGEREQAGRAWRAALSQGERFHMRCRSADAETRWISVHCAPISRGGDRAVVAHVGTMEDVTERIRAEEALSHAKAMAEAASVAKSQFLANISHEIRTPMTAILGFADLLTDPSVPEPERLAHVEIIRRNGRHLLELINDLLDLSKIESGRMTMEMIPCSPMQVLADVASMLQAQAVAKGLRLDVACDSPLPASIRSDPTRLKQVLLNVAGNALKFTQRGYVRIRAYVEGEGPQRICFEVQDSGIGMSAAEIARLFQPFSQADASITRRFGGTGLGLTISRRLAKMLGGDITVTSTPGEGSAFLISIAAHRAAEQEEGEETVVAPRAAPAQGAKLTCEILVAEDGPDNQRLIRHVLTKAGARVTMVADGRQAVEACGAIRFGVLLMDMQMPVMDGYEATRELRRRGYKGPIIALTANAADEGRARCLEAGCDDFVAKPFEAAKLVAACARWAAGPGAAV